MTTTDAVILLKAIKDSKTRLTDFEKDFCRSIVKRCALGRSISVSQGKILGQIYSRSQGQGLYERRQYVA